MGEKLTASQRHAQKQAGVVDPVDPAHSASSETPVGQAAAAQPDEARKGPRLKAIGGSDRDSFNGALANSVLATAWVNSQSSKDAAKTITTLGLIGIAPKDELEGMIAAQMVAAHQAAMECGRRAMLQDQTVEGRDMNLRHAAKASRTFATLLEALDRHRTKGQQRVVVEHVHRHVHVHEDGRSRTGATIEGGGGQLEMTSQPHEQAVLGYALEPTMRGENAERETVSVPGDD